MMASSPGYRHSVELVENMPGRSAVCDASADPHLRDNAPAGNSCTIVRMSRLRTMARWAATIACLLVAVAWMASTRWPMAKSFSSFRVEAYGGLLIIFVWGDGPEIRSSSSLVAVSLGTFGLEWPVASFDRNGFTYLSIPFWTCFLPLAALTAIAWTQRPRRFRPGECPSCGYDLRGNTAQTCPECGRASSAAPAGSEPQHE